MGFTWRTICARHVARARAFTRARGFLAPREMSPRGNFEKCRAHTGLRHRSYLLVELFKKHFLSSFRWKVFLHQILSSVFRCDFFLWTLSLCQIFLLSVWIHIFIQSASIQIFILSVFKSSFYLYWFTFLAGFQLDVEQQLLDLWKSCKWMFYSKLFKVWTFQKSALMQHLLHSLFLCITLLDCKNEFLA